MSAGSVPTRRELLGVAAGLIGGLGARAAIGAEPAAAPPAPPSAPPDATKVLGGPSTARAERSPFEDPAMVAGKAGKVSGTTFAPIERFLGTLTPTDLQFQRHHGGIAQIDPERYSLLLHGLVDRPLRFSLAELKRFPSVSRAHFVECAGNGRTAYREPTPDLTPQYIDGQLNNCEWTGVELGRVLREAGVKAGAEWLVVEGGDASVLARSLPLKKAMDDCLLVYAANGEPLRPAHGYPVRLLVPGWEANISIKWLRRIELAAQPMMAKDETSKYTDPLPGDKARMFSFVMDAKSIILSPSAPGGLQRGFWPISGVAWSGRGRIHRVDVSSDGGKTWTAAELQGPNTGKDVVRFIHPWTWDGSPTLLMSRAIDETGYVQPTYREFLAVRGKGTDYHFNPIRSFAVDANGGVRFVADPEAA